MKKLTGWFLLTSLCATTAVAMDEIGGAAPAVEVVPEVAITDSVELTAEVTSLEVTTFEATSRNTNIWRTGGELRQRLKKGFSIAVVSQYDRFDSDNEQYDSDRFLTGGLLTWEY